ncbi:MAG: MFS transporter [Streptosporangiaceae bacterium]
MISGESRRWWALASLSLSVLVVALDLFVLTLALPTVSADLHASSADLQWFVDAYSLVLAAALLPAGLLGDRIGRQRLLLWALAVFGLASLACAYSTSAAELIAARAVLGLAAAVILIALVAVFALMPESKGDGRPGVDLVGIAVSSAGLTSLTYGLIEAGQNGWTNPTAIVTMIAGAAALAAFAQWERRVSRLSATARRVAAVQPTPGH